MRVCKCSNPPITIKASEGGGTKIVCLKCSGVVIRENRAPVILTRKSAATKSK